MAQSQFTLRPLTAPDIPVCASIYFSSFQNPHSLACWPRTPAVRGWWETMFRDELHEPGAHWLVAVTTDSNEIAGFAKWQEPKSAGTLPSLDLPETWPEDADARLCAETFGAWAGEHRRVMGGRRHWYLEMLATAPEFQGQGIGSALIKWGLDRADAEGVEAYLEASPQALRLYEKLGFREAGRLDTWIENERVKGQWYRNVYMLRPAQGRGRGVMGTVRGVIEHVMRGGAILSA